MVTAIHRVWRRDAFRVRGADRCGDGPTPARFSSVTRVGRIAAIISAALAVLTIASWNNSTQSNVGGEAPLEGAMLFKAKGCASCHIGPDSSSGMSVGPPLIGASDWAGDRRSGMNAAEYLAESMRTPSEFISPEFNGGMGPMTGMPDLNLSEAEIDSPVSYLLG